MAWILIEGLDRSGKSTVAEYYKSQGFQIVHMSAPSKKYKDPLYTGASYFEEIYELYSKYTDIDVVWDRTSMGELVWPHVYGRKPMLTEDDIAELREIEARNKTKYLFMSDPDVKAHWDRCVANNEPLTKKEFKAAILLYRNMSSKYGFQQVHLPVFLEKHKLKMEDFDAPSKTHKPKSSEDDRLPDKEAHEKQGSERSGPDDSFSFDNDKTPEQLRLEKANAINSILSSKLIKRRGPVFDQLERDIKLFLNDRLASLFGKQTRDFTSKEVQILKTYCKLIDERDKRGK